MTPDRMRRPNIGLNRTVAIPPAWRTAPVQLMEAIATAETDDGHEILFSLGMLADGTNIGLMLYPGGARWLRACEATGWRIEAVTRGKPPWANHVGIAEQMWAIALECARRGHDAAVAIEQMPAEERRQHERRSVLRALTATMRMVADGLANGDGHDDEARGAHMDRIRSAIGDAFRSGADRADVAAAIARAKEGRGPNQAAVLDTLIAAVIDLPDDPRQAAA